VIQGVYYCITGLWPLVHMESFEALTGKKRDDWLVKTVGALIAVVGAALLLSPRPAAGRDVALGVGSAVALGGAGTIYAMKGRISAIYLMDAAVEAALVGLWLAGWHGALRARRPSVKEGALGAPNQG
jgi:hypothetical protein